MRVRVLMCACVLTVTAAACDRSTARGSDSADQVSSPPADSSRSGTPRSPWTVDARGIGAVRAGMSLQELSGVLGEQVQPTYQGNETCEIVQPRALPKGVFVMILYDSVARVDVMERGPLTSEGASIGDHESRILELYAGRARVEPHKYTGPIGHYVIVTPPEDTLHRIIFETDGQRVLRYRAGRLPGVRFVEGCS